MAPHAAPCVTSPAIFQHPFVEDPAAAREPENQLEARRLVTQATLLCATCPVFEKCLYAAVAEHDVAGIAAGTTQAQRNRMRKLVGVRVAPDDLGDFAGTSREGSRLSHAEVVRLRRANPDASLELIAEWLGCSLSTVKRHLRQARATGVTATATPRRPSVEAVLNAYDVVVGRPRRSQVA